MDQSLTTDSVLDWLRAHRLPEREPEEIDLDQASQALGLGAKQTRDTMRKFVKANEFTERVVRCPTGQPMTVWRKVITN